MKHLLWLATILPTTCLAFCVAPKFLPSGDASRRIPCYTLEDLFTIFAESQDLAVRQELRRTYSLQLEELKLSLWRGQIGLDAAADQLFLANQQQPGGYREGVVELYEGSTVQEKYARCLLRQMRLALSEHVAPEGTPERMQALEDEFWCLFKADPQERKAPTDEETGIPWQTGPVIPALTPYLR